MILERVFAKNLVFTMKIKAFLRLMILERNR